MEERDRKRRQKQKELDIGRGGEIQRPIEELQDALLLEHSTYDNVEEVDIIVEGQNKFEEVHFERQLVNEFEEINKENLGDIEGTKAMGDGTRCNPDTTT